MPNTIEAVSRQENARIPDPNQNHNLIKVTNTKLQFPKRRVSFFSFRFLLLLL